MQTGSSQNYDQTKALGPSTASLPANSGSPSTGGDQQNNNQSGKSSLNVGAIAGGVIGGLAFLVVVGGILLRRRISGEVGGDHPEDLGHSSGVVVDENDMQLSEMRLYVSFFVLLSNLFSDRR